MSRSKPRVIIWGFPLYSHTHSYVHQAWYRAFKHMGYDTYWFHDGDFPEDFDYSNCLFITEGYADKKIPINSSSTYFVHYSHTPSRYLERGARLIDIRFNVDRIKDFTYDYVTDRSKYEKLNDCTYYESYTSDQALREKYRTGVSGYEAIYVSWATNLIPEEIDLDDRFIQRENKLWYVGSIWSANYLEIEELKRACKDYNVEFIHNNPWETPMTLEESVEAIKKSYMAPDIRGTGPTADEVTAEESSHLNMGLIPCRIFKNISYGQLGISNSPAVDKLFGGSVIFDTNIYNMFEKALPHLKNYDLIKEQMEYVKQNHTYVNRIDSVLKVYYK